MKLIDVDNIEAIKSDIHYIKIYKGSAVLMDDSLKIFRFNIEFTIEHKPIGEPLIKIKFIEHPHFTITDLIQKMKKKIFEMDSKGALLQTR